MNLFDTHCHLQFAKLAEDVSGVLKRATEADVNNYLCVGTTVGDSQQAIEIAGLNDHVWAAVGVHPHDAKDFKPSLIDEFRQLLGKPKVKAVGEIGLDYYKNYSPVDIQTKTLKQLLDASQDTDLPYVFHVRDAFEDFWPIYDSYPKMPGVIHSFSAGRKVLDEILKRDLYVGLNGIMTFTKDEAQLAAAKAVPLDRLLLETDAPYLTPAAHRGQICEPKHIRDIAEFLADLRGESLDELANATTTNAKKLFGIES